MSVRLSPKHGLNPSLAVCFFCGEDNGEIIIPGMMKGDREAPRRACWNMDPCAKCAEHMKAGIILIEATPTKDGPDRTGRQVVVRDEMISRVFSPAELVADILKKRVAFIEPQAWQELGLPTQ